jgi:hypothetical protein
MPVQMLRGNTHQTILPITHSMTSDRASAKSVLSRSLRIGSHGDWLTIEIVTVWYDIVLSVRRALPVLMAHVSLRAGLAGSRNRSQRDDFFFTRCTVLLFVASRSEECQRKRNREDQGNSQRSHHPRKSVLNFAGWSHNCFSPVRLLLRSFDGQKTCHSSVLRARFVPVSARFVPNFGAPACSSQSSDQKPCDAAFDRISKPI